MRRYRYVGPEAIRARDAGLPRGREVASARDLDAPEGHVFTFVVDGAGVLRVADRRTEHVACAGGEDVLSAGELTVGRGPAGAEVTAISNQSTGYCPEPESWLAVAAALDRARIPHPGGFTFEATFRLCPGCANRNLVKDGWFWCDLCGAALPAAWNFEK